MRKYYGECGQVTHHQLLIPEHLIAEFLKAIHGQMGKHPGITKMIQECRSKYYYPGMAKRIKQLIMQCEDCIKYKRMNNSQIRPKMINNTEHVLGPEYILEIDIVPNLPNSAGYQNIVTMINVFSRYLFAYPTQNATAKTIGRCIVDVMIRHAYLPTLILSDKGSQFRSEVVAEIKQILEIQIRPCVHKTSTNNRSFRRDTRFNQDRTKNIDGRKAFNVAQICSNCSHEL